MKQEEAQHVSTGSDFRHGLWTGSHDGHPYGLPVALANGFVTRVVIAFSPFFPSDLLFPSPFWHLPVPSRMAFWIPVRSGPRCEPFC